MRRMLTAVALLALVLAAAPVVAQATISASNPTFSWTGKQGDDANYDWSATLSNPSRRDATVNVRIELLDRGGNVVGSDSQSVMIDRESETSVGGSASVGFDHAAQAAQYRIVVEGVEE